MTDKDLEQYLKGNNSGASNIDNFEPKITTVKYFKDSEKYALIYDNFEIFEKDLFEEIIKNKNIQNNNLLECCFIEGKIIINYDNLNNKEKFVSAIGTINYEKTFETEHVLICKDNYNREKEITKIENELLNYLNNFQFFNNNAPIIDNKYNEIGIIVKLNLVLRLVSGVRLAAAFSDTPYICVRTSRRCT